MVTNVHFIGDDGISLPLEIHLKKNPVDAQRLLFAFPKTEGSHILLSSYKEKHIVLPERSTTLIRNATIGPYSAPGVTNMSIYQP